MARGEMLTVFAYDVSDNRRRRKLARVLEQVATRVQGSVFEARMTRRAAESAGRQAARHLGQGDSLRLYAVGADGLSRSRVLGDGPPFESTEGFWIV